MTFRLDRESITRGFRLGADFMVRGTVQGSTEGFLGLFFWRWGLRLRFGPRWAVG